jgi:ABC-type branched-subunit amino acid transport system ATPase component
MVFTELEGIRDRGIGIVMVEQNARRALTLADRGIRARHGAATRTRGPEPICSSTRASQSSTSER